MAVPEGLRFLEAGWWLIHLLAVALVYVYGYRRGRVAGRREAAAVAAPAPRA